MPAHPFSTKTSDLATYALKLGGHCDNYGPDDEDGNPTNLTGEVDKEETVILDGKKTTVTTKKAAPMRRFHTANERNPAIFKSPQQDLHIRFPHKYQRMDQAGATFTKDTKPVPSNAPNTRMLEVMTKPQLFAMAAEQGVEVDESYSKNQLITALRAHEDTK